MIYLTQITYRKEEVNRYDSTLGFDVFDKSIFCKYSNDEVVWSLEVTEFWIEGYELHNGNVLIYGQTPSWDSSQESYAWIAWVSDDGNILWKQKLQNDFTDESVDAVVIEDSKITVFSRGELKYLCMSQYDYSGTLLQSKITEIGNHGIWRATKLDDGYIVQLGSFTNNEYARIVKINESGELIKTYS